MHGQRRDFAGSFQERKLTGYAKIAERIIGHKVHKAVKFRPLVGFPWVQLPQAIQPCKLEQLLREEEASDEERLFKESTDAVLSVGAGCLTCGEKKLRF